MGSFSYNVDQQNVYNSKVTTLGTAEYPQVMSHKLNKDKTFTQVINFCN